MQSSNKTLQKKAKLPKPYNNYNLFFILERTRLIEAKQTGATAASDKTVRPSLHSSHASPATATAPLSGYEFVEIPPLPPRYQHLKSSLAENWYDPGRNKLVKRKHSKSHGMISFREFARTVANNWKAVDPVTKQFIEAVATLLKRRHQEMSQIGGLGCFSVGQPPMPMMPFQNSASCQMTRPKKFTKKAPPSPSQMEQRGKTLLTLAPQTSHLQQYEMATTKPVTATVSPTTTMTQIHPQSFYPQTIFPQTIYPQYSLQIEPDIILSPLNPNVSPNIMCLPENTPGSLIMEQVNYFNSNMNSMTHMNMCQDVNVGDADILNTFESF